MRIGIVNDMALAREALRRVVESNPSYHVAWMAEDGASAVRLAASDRPDAILMDLVMPGMDGAEATRQIMARSPCPILIVTSTVAGNYSLVLQAMGHGGLDAIHTPEGACGGTSLRGQELLARLARLERAKNMPLTCARPLPLPPARTDSTLNPLLVLGASTGGPEALATVLSHLPARFPFGVLVVQHISAEFGPNLVSWLGSRLKLPVEIARAGETPHQGFVSVAVSNDHLVLDAQHRFRYTVEPRDDPYRPSVNALFESLALHWSTPGIGVLLTGMGQDGARGLGMLRQQGWLTIAQSECSCVVYGMPRAAVECNAASRVLPLHHIGPAIVARCSCNQH
ncbi:MAG: chemotaxis-specific protein-glutamate methyltransferase CheB [Gemmataceae bacterium]